MTSDLVCSDRVCRDFIPECVHIVYNPPYIEGSIVGVGDCDYSILWGKYSKLDDSILKNMVHVLLRGGMNRACEIGDIGAVRALISNGALVHVKISYPYTSPLMYAVANGHALLVSYLLDHGARLQYGNHRVIRIAVEALDVEILKILLSRKPKKKHWIYDTLNYCQEHQYTEIDTGKRILDILLSYEEGDRKWEFL